MLASVSPTVEPQPLDAEEVKGVLRHHGLRITLPRIDVLQVLLASSHPQSHADVVAALRDKPHDRATVYRNLLQLLHAGLVERHHFGDNVWRFTLSPQHRGPHIHTTENPHRHHPHFVCTQCHAVSCYPLAVDMATALGGKHKDLPYIEEVVLRGTCQHCRD